MNKNIVPAEEAHRTLGKMIREAANREAYSIITRHGIATVAIVPINGMYAWALTKAMREAEQMEADQA